MFLDLEGNVIDFFDGMTDLRNKVIRFVGDPSERIKEDYLRIFRYFRFYIRYGFPRPHDQRTLDAIHDNRDGLSQISGERIWTESKKILKLQNCDSVVPLILNDLGIGPYMGIETHPVGVSEFRRVHAALFSEQPAPLFEPITLLTSLLLSESDLNSCAKRLKISRVEHEIAGYIITNRNVVDDGMLLKKLQKQLALAPKSEQKQLVKFICEFLRYKNRHDLLDRINGWEIPVFPSSNTARDILKEKTKNLKGEMIGRIRSRLRQEWADNDFYLKDDEIRQIIDDTLQQTSSLKS